MSQDDVMLVDEEIKDRWCDNPMKFYVQQSISRLYINP